MSAESSEKDKSKVHKLSLKGRFNCTTVLGSRTLIKTYVRLIKADRRICESPVVNASSTSNILKFEYSINTILFQRGVYPAEDFTPVKKYGLNMLVTSDDQVKAYIKKIMSQLNKWMTGGKISKLVVVITSKETGENVERWQFDVQIFGKGASKKKSSREARKPVDKENAPT